MGRVLSTAFCVALLVAAAAAFALTEGAKTTLSPIYGTKIDKIFSPVCDPHICAQHVANIVFKLRSSERLEVWIVTASGARRVRTLVNGRHYAKGRVHLVFDGHSDAGALLPDGSYLPVVRLLGDHRTITLPNPIQIDTKAPRIRRVSRSLHDLLAPGAAGRPQSVVVPYTLSAPGHGVLFVDGHRVAFSYRQRVSATITWYGTIDGRAVAPGVYTLELAVQDEAGNRSAPLRVGHVTVTYLSVAPTGLHVRSRARFELRIPIGPAHVHWLFAGKRGTGGRLLHLRAPKRRGRYRVYVSAGGHGASALVVVT